MPGGEVSTLIEGPETRGGWPHLKGRIPVEQKVVDLSASAHRFSSQSRFGNPLIFHQFFECGKIAEKSEKLSKRLPKVLQNGTKIDPGGAFFRLSRNLDF